MIWIVRPVVVIGVGDNFGGSVYHSLEENVEVILVFLSHVHVHQAHELSIEHAGGGEQMWEPR